MKIKKIMILTAIFFSTILIGNIASAYTVKIDDVTAEKGEQFTVNFEVDEKTYLANGRIKFDNKKIQFVEAKQEHMSSSLTADDELSWIYVDLEGEGVNNFEFVFKVIKKGESELKFGDLALVDYNGNEYTVDNITGNTAITINKGEKSGGNGFLIIIGVLIVLIVVVFVSKKKKK